MVTRMTTVDLDQLDPDTRRQVQLIISSGQQRLEHYRARYAARPTTPEGRTAEKLARRVRRVSEPVTRSPLRDVVHRRDVIGYSGTKGELLDAALIEAVKLGYIRIVGEHPLTYGPGPVAPPAA